MAYSGAICIIDTITHAVNIEVEYGTHLTDLVATFTLSEGAVAKVGDIVQESEITANDFTNPLTYTITAEDGLTVQDWIVTVIQINTTPILVMELGDAELEVEEFYEFDLDDIFSDPDGDPLSFSAVSSDDAIATALVSDNTLTVTAVVDGTTTITINADDGLGGTVATSFNVIVFTMITSIEQVGDELPDKYALFQNFPNQFNKLTTIAFDLPQQSKVTLKVYDELGGVVASLASGEYPAGHFEVSWDVKSLPSGIYTYQLEAGRYLEAKKLILMR